MGMKVAISANGSNLDALVDPRFGRCPFFILIDPENMEYEVIRNEASQSMGGAGIKAAQTVIKSGARAVITGNMGPNAFAVLKAEGVKIYAGVSGKIKDVIQQFKEGKLKESESASVERHFGMRK